MQRRLLLLPLVAVLVAGFAFPTPTRSDVTLLQQLFVMKELKPDMERVGVLWPADKSVQDALMTDLQKAGAAAGVKLFTAEVGELKDVAARFRDLTRAHDIQVLWIVDESGALGEEMSRKFLIKNALGSKISLLAPSKGWVDEGAPVAFAKADGSIQLLINKGAADVLALSIPEKYQDRTQFLAMN